MLHDPRGLPAGREIPTAVPAPWPGEALLCLDAAENGDRATVAMEGEVGLRRGPPQSVPGEGGRGTEVRWVARGGRSALAFGEGS